MPLENAPSNGELAGDLNYNCSVQTSVSCLLLLL